MSYFPSSLLIRGMVGGILASAVNAEPEAAQSGPKGVIFVLEGAQLDVAKVGKVLFWLRQYIDRTCSKRLHRVAGPSFASFYAKAGLIAPLLFCSRLLAMTPMLLAARDSHTFLISTLAPPNTPAPSVSTASSYAVLGILQSL